MATDFLKVIHILDANVFKLFTGFWFLTFPQIIFFKFVCSLSLTVLHREDRYLPSQCLSHKIDANLKFEPKNVLFCQIKWRGPSRWDSCEHFSFQLEKFLLSFGLLWTFEVVFERLTSVLGERKQELIWTDRSPNTAGFSGRLKRSRSKSRQRPRSFVWTKTPDSITVGHSVVL